MSEEKELMLDEDLTIKDNLLDQISFEELILTVHCNCRKITPEAVMSTLKMIMEMRIEDAKCLMERNMDKIIEKAKEGREL